MEERFSETEEEWHVRVRCTAEEVPSIAAALPKMLAAMQRTPITGDVIHIHQIAAPETKSLSRIPSYARN